MLNIDNTITSNNILRPQFNRMLSSDGKIKHSLLSSADQTLADLTDVTLSPINNFDIISYDSTTSKWKNTSNIDISKISNFNINNPATSDILTYNGSKWVNCASNQQIKKVITVDNLEYIMTKDNLNYVDVGYIYVLSNVNAGFIRLPINPNDNTKVLIYGLNSNVNNVTINSGNMATINDYSNNYILDNNRTVILNYKSSNDSWEIANNFTSEYILLDKIDTELIQIYTQNTTTLNLPVSPSNGFKVRIQNVNGFTTNISSSELINNKTQIVQLNDPTYIIYQFVYFNGNWSYSSEIPYLSNMFDVNINSLVNGQILAYNSSSNKWVNANNSVGASSLSSLSDVNISLLSDNQILNYNSSSSKWINSTLTTSSSVATLTDVTLTTLTNKDIIRYDGTKWVNSPDLTNAEKNIANLQLASCVIKTNLNTAQNSVIVTNYVDGTDGNIIYNNSNSPYYYIPSSFIYTEFNFDTGEPYLFHQMV